MTKLFSHTHCWADFASDLSFAIWDLFEIWDLYGFILQKKLLLNKSKFRKLHMGYDSRWRLNRISHEVIGTNLSKHFERTGR